MYGRDIVAPPGNQVAPENTNFCLQHWESPVYSTKTHAATFEFSGTKRVWESSCPQVTVSVTE